MIATIGMVFIVVILNPIFIFGLKMGMRGSALGQRSCHKQSLLCYQLHHFNNKINCIHFQKGIFRLRMEYDFKDDVNRSFSILHESDSMRGCYHYHE